METFKIPPFKDAHTHFMVEGKPAPEDSWPALLGACRDRGIFFLQDMGLKGGPGLEAKEKAAKIGIKIRTCGWALFRQGTYGSFLGEGISGAKEIPRAIDKLASSGADFVKILNSGIVSLKNPGRVTEGGFTPEMLVLLVKEAVRHGLEVICHANSDCAVREAVQAGVHAIEHGFFISRETLTLMAKRGVSWTPTVFALATLISVLPPGERGALKKIIEDHLAAMNYAANIGVNLQIGTDSGSRGVRHGEAFFEELYFFQKAGLSLDRILQAACLGKEEIDRGNYLVVREDFITRKKIESP